MSTNYIFPVLACKDLSECLQKQSYLIFEEKWGQDISKCLECIHFLHSLYPKGCLDEKSMFNCLALIFERNKYGFSRYSFLSDLLLYIFHYYVENANMNNVDTSKFMFEVEKAYINIYLDGKKGTYKVGNCKCSVGFSCWADMNKKRFLCGYCHSPLTPFLENNKKNKIILAYPLLNSIQQLFNKANAIKLT